MFDETDQEKLKILLTKNKTTFKAPQNFIFYRIDENINVKLFVEI